MAKDEFEAIDVRKRAAVNQQLGTAVEETTKPLDQTKLQGEQAVAQKSSAAQTTLDIVRRDRKPWLIPGLIGASLLALTAAIAVPRFLPRETAETTPEPAASSTEALPSAGADTAAGEAAITEQEATILLGQAELLAKSNEAKSLTDAISIARSIPPETEAYETAQTKLEAWQEQLLALRESNPEAVVVSPSNAGESSAGSSSARSTGPSGASSSRPAGPTPQQTAQINEVQQQIDREIALAETARQERQSAQSQTAALRDRASSSSSQAARSSAPAASSAPTASSAPAASAAAQARLSESQSRTAQLRAQLNAAQAETSQQRAALSASASTAAATNTAAASTAAQERLSESQARTAQLREQLNAAQTETAAAQETLTAARNTTTTQAAAQAAAAAAAATRPAAAQANTQATAQAPAPQPSAPQATAPSNPQPLAADDPYLAALPQADVPPASAQPIGPAPIPSNSYGFRNVTVNAASVAIELRDNVDEDGDFVTLLVNGQTYASYQQIWNRGNVIIVPLEPGHNEVQIIGDKDGEGGITLEMNVAGIGNVNSTPIPEGSSASFYITRE